MTLKEQIEEYKSLQRLEEELKKRQEEIKKSLKQALEESNVTQLSIEQYKVTLSEFTQSKLDKELLLKLAPKAVERATITVTMRRMLIK